MSTSNRLNKDQNPQKSSQDNKAETKSPEDLYQNADAPANLSGSSTQLTEAAVCVPLIHENTGWSVLYIRRAENQNDRHSGQVAFPGGRRDMTDDSLVATALRELFEEIGIGGSQIKLLGQLPDYTTISNYIITPVVGIVPWPTELTLQTEEVARVFSIPLQWLMDQNNVNIRYITRKPSGLTTATEERNSTAGKTRHPVIYYHEFDGEVLWGATARMTLNLTRAISNGEIVLPVPNNR